MEKINIAELLKDCPKGMELYSTIHGAVYFEGVRDTGYATLIDVTAFDNTKVQFYPDGKFNTCYSDSEMTLFPSKDVRTWERFHRPFVDGDIITDSFLNTICIFKGEGSLRGMVDFYCGIGDTDELFIKDVKDRDEHFGEINGYDFATEDEKETLFKVIKYNGYKWNAETKTLEKLPRFKVGDRIKEKQSGVIGEVIDVQQKKYNVKVDDNKGLYVYFREQDNWELLPNKFDITTLKPFDKVLVRDNNQQKWTIDYFSFADKEQVYPFICVGHYVSQCIPYEGNEHLLGTTNDCDEYYKTW